MNITAAINDRFRRAGAVARYDFVSESQLAERLPETAAEARAGKKGGKRGSWKRIGGAPAFVGPDGTIKKGCPGLKGENVGDLIDEPQESRDRREARQAHHEARGVKGHETTVTAAKKWESQGAQRQHDAAKRAGKRFGVKTPDVLARLDEAHKLRMEEWQRTETARAGARRLAGMNAGNLSRVENAYRDYSSVPGFDEAAASFAVEHPDMGFGQSGDLSAEVWDFIREGSAPKPAIHDDETAEMAAQMVAKPNVQPETWDRDDASWGDDVGSDASFDVSRFTRAFSAAVERYAAKKKPAAGQGEFRWITIGGGDEGPGTHVLIDDKGNIGAGPPSLEGRNLNNLKAGPVETPNGEGGSEKADEPEPTATEQVRTPYEDALARRTLIEAAMKEAKRAVDSFPRHPNGLTPDHVKANPEYRAAKSQSDKLFRQLQEINGIIVAERKKLPKTSPKPETAGPSWEKRERKPKRSPDGPRSFADIRPEHTAGIVDAIKAGRHREAAEKFDALMGQTKARQFEAHMLMQKLRDEAGIKPKTRAERKAESRGEVASQPESPAVEQPKPPAPKPTIPGQQSSLFGGDDLRTGQKALFNVAKPTGKPKSKAAADITAGLDAAVRAKLSEKDTLSPADLSMRLQDESIEGQKEMFSRVRHRFERAFYRRVVRYAKAWDESKVKRGQPENSGQFASKGVGFVSPNDSDEVMPLRDAIAALASDEHKAAKTDFVKIDEALGLKAECLDTLGDWKDGSENSLMFQYEGIEDFEDVRYAMALKGRHANQKAVLVFQIKESGNDSLWRFELDDTIEGVSWILESSEIRDRTFIFTQSGKTAVEIIDKGGSLRQHVRKVAEHYGAQPRRTKGTAEFIEGDTREIARRRYEQVIREHEGRRRRQLVRGRYQASAADGLRVHQGLSLRHAGRSLTPLQRMFAHAMNRRVRSLTGAAS